MRFYPFRKEYLICYDITDDKIRSSVFKELEQYGLKPIQKSVFWGYLTQAERLAIKRHLQNKLEKGDKAFISKASFNGKGPGDFIGHTKGDFTDWKETDVI